METTDVAVGRGRPRITMAPAPCPHCGKTLSAPPAWLKVVETMSPGRGTGEPAMSLTAIAEMLHTSRQRAFQMVESCVKAGVLEIPKDVVGSKVYRRTKYAGHLVGLWRKAGWNGRSIR